MSLEIKPEFKDHVESLNIKKNLVGRFCDRPFATLEIHKNFYTFPCCPSWLPVVVGNCEEDSIMGVWNGEKMQKIRQSIHDGSFAYCDHLECPKIQANRLPLKSEVEDFQDVIKNSSVKLEQPPKDLALCYDESCNLACPSCRAARVNVSSGPDYERRLKFTQQVIEYIDKYSAENEIWLRVTGSGDPIASTVFYKLLRSLDAKKHPRLKISLQTNAVMLTEKVWANLSKIHPIIKALSISIDAASEATYQKVRKFGAWSQLMKNLEYLTKIRSENKFKNLDLNFVVQKENYHEMADFVKLAKKFVHIDQVFFSFVNNWDTWSKEDFEKQCVWKTSHPLFLDFMKHLKNPVFADPIVNLGNITEYYVRANTDHLDDGRGN